MTHTRPALLLVSLPRREWRMHAVGQYVEVVQNQRWIFGIWVEPWLCRPTFTDWAPWSSDQGDPLEEPLQQPPGRDGEYGWRIVKGSATDADGWQYARGFDRLACDRDGGRACKRALDVVRSRVWRRSANYDEFDSGKDHI